MVDKKLFNIFALSFYDMERYIHDWAVGKGFWEKGKDRNDGEMIALFHSELSEALEALRHGNPQSESIPEFTQVEEELADLIIRIMDTAYARNWRIPSAIIEKMKYNETRPYKHNKKF